MALITCEECSSQISSQATSCPKCGFPIGDSPSDETFSIRPEGKNAFRVNRSKSQSIDLVIKASQKLGYRFLVQTDGIKVTGKNPMGSKPNAFISFVEGTAKNSTLLTFADISFTGIINRTHMLFPKMTLKLVEAISSIGLP